MNDLLPLRRGSYGDAVSDLQHRLTKLGFACSGGHFDDETEAAVSSFQAQRGLRRTGEVDEHAWATIVEAGYALGDRPLYRRRPMLRGDDVADLQRRLSQLGFDPGRIDGIFGDETVVALTDFQRNAGLRADGVCGRRTLLDLERLTTRAGGGDLVSPLRERLLLANRGACTLADRTIAVGESGGYAVGVASICRALERVGATTVPLQHPDASHRAAEANAARADCVVDLHLVPQRDDCTTAYYRGFRYESEVSRRLAQLIQAQLPAAVGLRDGGAVGMALPILRETRMPAVEIALGAPPSVVPRSSDLAQAVAAALANWVTATWL